MPLDNDNEEIIFLAGAALDHAAITTAILSSDGTISQMETLTLTGLNKDDNSSSVTHIFCEEALLFGLTQI